MIKSISNGVRMTADTPAPAPPTPPPASSDVVDLSHIDNPVAALVMPFNDLVSAMAAGNGDTPQTANVHLQGGGQTLDYTITPSQTQVDVKGSMNGQAFALQVTPDVQNGQVKIAGDTPGGKFDNTLESFPGGFGISGQTGAVPFKEQMTLNPLGPLSGDIASIEGNFGADALKESISVAQDGQSLKVAGALGPRNIEETISQGPNGTILIHGVIGSFTFDETITKG